MTMYTIKEDTLLATKYGAQIIAVIKRVVPRPEDAWIGDWAAYGPGYGTGNDVEAIRRSGDKILEEDARALFPQVEDDLPYRE